MDELIQQLTAKLGIDASVAQSASNKAFSVIRERAGEDLFSSIASAIPNAEAAAEAGAAEPVAAGGGMLGKLAAAASGALGGSAGGAVEFGAALSSTGLDTSQFGAFAETILDFIKDKAGESVVGKLLDEVPMLKSLIG